MLILIPALVTILHVVASSSNLATDLPQVVIRAVNPDFTYRELPDEASRATDYLDDLSIMANQILPTTRPAKLYR